MTDPTKYKHTHVMPWGERVCANDEDMLRRRVHLAERREEQRQELVRRNAGVKR